MEAWAACCWSSCALTVDTRDTSSETEGADDGETSSAINNHKYSEQAKGQSFWQCQRDVTMDTKTRAAYAWRVRGLHIFCG
jgi:hypothetical protein